MGCCGCRAKVKRRRGSPHQTKRPVLNPKKIKGIK